MIIGISGSQSQGKSTLVEALKQREEFKSFTFKPSPTRDLQKMGIPINQVGTDVTQMYIMCKHYEYACTSGDVILDRCALDGLAYTNVILKKYDDNDFKHALGIIARKCINLYDIIFYVRPELKLVDDGTRAVDVDFFDEVNESFTYWLDAIKFYKTPVPVVELHGSVENRVWQVVDALKRHNLIV